MPNHKHLHGNMLQFDVYILITNASISAAVYCLENRKRKINYFDSEKNALIAEYYVLITLLSHSIFPSTKSQCLGHISFSYSNAIYKYIKIILYTSGGPPLTH